MTLDVVAQWVAFGVFSFIAVSGGLGMTTTMSMFRSGTFLMASFVGVAGLFLLLSADLLGMLQVMMYLGGMLVMILFMLRFSHDPGGDMMASMMALPFVERAFSAGLKRPGMQQQQQQQHGGHGGMQHEDMSMFTPAKRLAFGLSLLVGAGLITVLVLSRPWPTVDDLPPPDSASRVGHLLMGKYMIAFEGAGLLILLGIFGGVYLSRPGRFPDATGRRELQAAVDDQPAPVDEDTLAPTRARSRS